MKSWAAVVLLALAACSPQPSNGTASPSRTAAPSVAASQPAAASPPRVALEPGQSLGSYALLVVDDRANQQMRLVTVDGRTAGRIVLNGPKTLLAATPDFLFLRDDTSHELFRIDRQSTVIDYGPLPADRIKVRPDGQAVVYRQDRSLCQHSAVAGCVAIFQEAPSSQLFPEPYRWTAAGLVIAHRPNGLGGYSLFDAPSGATDLLDPASKRVTPLTDAACQFGDRRPDGGLACLRRNSDGSTRLEITLPGKSFNVDLPRPAFTQAGDALFTPDGSQLLVAGAPGDGAGHEHYRTFAVDLGSGSLALLADGYKPAFGPDSFLPDGSLLLSQPVNGEGLWVRSPSGAVAPVAAGGPALGIVPAAI